MQMLKSSIKHLRPSWMLLISMMMQLTSCTTANFNACPPIVEYTSEFQERAYHQASVMSVGSPIWIMLNDYSKLRGELRACHGDE